MMAVRDALGTRFLAALRVFGDRVAQNDGLDANLKGWPSIGSPIITRGVAAFTGMVDDTSSDGRWTASLG
jgi:hypothetical protein